MKKHLGLLLGGLVIAGTVHAAGPFTVNTFADTHDANPGAGTAKDSGGNISLRSAIEEADASAGTTTINLASGTYNLSLGDLLPGTAANTTIYVHGTGTPVNTIIHQTQAGDMLFDVDFNVTANVVFILDNVTLSGGSENENDTGGFGGNGGAILAGGSSSAPGNVLSLTNVVFDHDYCSPVSNAGATGGAIDMTGGGNLNIYNCTFNGCEASKLKGTGAGGAIYFDAGFAAGNVTIQNTLFTNNIAHGSQGGAIYLAGGAGNIYTVNGNTFITNSAGAQGGAIFLSTGNLTANYNRFTGDTASSANGIYVVASTSPIATADARNNWWGNSTGPNTAGSLTTFPNTSSTLPLSGGQIAYNPWLVLGLYANPSAILSGNSATVTATFLTNSAGTGLTASNMTAMAGDPIIFGNAIDGSLSGAQSAIQASGTATVTFTGLAGGGNGLVQASVDNAGATAFITVEQLPLITSTNTTTFQVGSPGTFAVTDTGFPAPNLSVSGAFPSGVTLNLGTGNLSGTPAVGTGGSYPLVITAINIAGTNTQNFTLNVNQPAAITSANNATFIAGSAGTFNVTASGFPVPSLTELGALPAGVNFTNATGVLGGTPAPGTGGVYPISFTAHNGIGSDFVQSFDLTVNEAPNLNCPGTITTNIPGGMCLPSIAFASTVSGFPTPVVTYQLQGSPITSPVTFPLGDNHISVTASNLAGTSTCGFDVVVQAGPPPVLAIAPLQYEFSGYSSNKLGVPYPYSNLITAQLTWPANASCFQLQSSTSPLGPWSFIPTGGGNTLTISINPDKPAVYYRLNGLPP